MARRRSLFAYSPALILVAIAVADAIRFADPDLWGHVAFGRATLAAHHLARTDPYSYSASGHRWLNHEWLAEVIEAAAYDALGVIGLKLMKLSLSACTIAFLAVAESETDAPELVQFAVLVCAAIVLAPSMQFRPQLFTFALFALLMALLARDTYRGRAPLWLAVPMLALWSNLHGGFIVGLATLATYTFATAIFDLARKAGARRALVLGAIALVAVLATLCTPFGLGTWRAVAQALANPYTPIAIGDWQPPLRAAATAWHTSKLESIYDLLPLAFIVALIISIAISRNLDDLTLLAVAAVMSVAALLAVRNGPLATIAIASPLACHASLALRKNRAPLARVRFANQAVISLLAVGLLVATGLFSNRLSARERYPVGAVGFMKEHRLEGNILNDFLWGEYLIWHLAPGSKVFIDGRYDTVYPQDVILEFMKFHFDQDGGADILDRWPHDYVLIAPDSAPSRIMSARRDWIPIYRDSASMLYARAGSMAAKVTRAPSTAASQPVSFP